MREHGLILNIQNCFIVSHVTITAPQKCRPATKFYKKSFKALPMTLFFATISEILLMSSPLQFYSLGFNTSIRRVNWASSALFEIKICVLKHKRVFKKSICALKQFYQFFVTTTKYNYKRPAETYCKIILCRSPEKKQRWFNGRHRIQLQYVKTNCKFGNNEIYFFLDIYVFVIHVSVSENHQPLIVL